MNKLRLALAIAAFTAVTQAQAEINFRGFGSFVAGIGTGLDDPVDGEDAPNVLGYEDSLSFKQDSLLALQVDSDMGDGLSATMQLVTRGKNNYDVDVEWAYLTYEINDSWQVSAGRIRAPFYRYSDFFDVRYAYNWVTAPTRVYDFDFPGFDGLSFLHTASFGSVDSSLQIVAGRLDEIVDGSPMILDNFIGFSWVASWEWLTFRAGYNQSKATIDLEEFQTVADTYEMFGQAFSQLSLGYTGLAASLMPFDPVAAARFDDFDTSDNDSYAEGLRQGAAVYSGLVDDVLLQEDSGSYKSLGLSAEYESFLMDAEVVNYGVDDAMVPERTAYYVTLGWRVGPTVIYGTYSREKGDALTKITSRMPDLTGFSLRLAEEPALASPSAAPLLQGTLATIDGAETLRASLDATEADIVNTHVGVRWDFHSSAALKFAYEKQNDKINSVDGGVFRTAIDFVF